MRLENLLAEKLRAVNFDLSRLSDTERAEVFRLARAAGVELPHQNESWASTPAGDNRRGVAAPMSALGVEADVMAGLQNVRL